MDFIYIQIINMNVQCLLFIDFKLFINIRTFYNLAYKTSLILSYNNELHSASRIMGYKFIYAFIDKYITIYNATWIPLGIKIINLFFPRNSVPILGW